MAHQDDNEMLQVKVWRGRETGHFDEFSVPKRSNQTVLDVVTSIQREQDTGLSYRFSCRVGVCGSCAMVVNGRPRWTCRTHVRGLGSSITLEPLSNMRRIKDLVVDMGDFFDKWTAVGSDFTSKRSRHDRPSPINPKSEKRKAVDAAIECINCGVCHSACDVVGWNADYLGPAALNRAWSLVNDERHEGGAKTLAAATDSGGCSNCHTMGQCMLTCPIGLSPTASISGLKKHALKSLLGL